MQVSSCLALQAKDVCNMINMCRCYSRYYFHNAKFTKKKILNFFENCIFALVLIGWESTHLECYYTCVGI